MPKKIFLPFEKCKKVHFSLTSSCIKLNSIVYFFSFFCMCTLSERNGRVLWETRWARESAVLWMYAQFFFSSLEHNMKRAFSLSVKVLHSRRSQVLHWDYRERFADLFIFFSRLFIILRLHLISQYRKTIFLAFSLGFVWNKISRKRNLVTVIESPEPPPSRSDQWLRTSREDYWIYASKSMLTHYE